MGKGWEKGGCRVGKGRVRSFFPDSQRLFSHTDYASFSVCIFSPHIKGTKNAEINGLNRNFFRTKLLYNKRKTIRKGKKVTKYGRKVQKGIEFQKGHVERNNRQ